MNFGPCFPDFTPDTTFSFASSQPRPRLFPARRRSLSISLSRVNSHANLGDFNPPVDRPRAFPTTPASGSRSRSPPFPPPGQDQNETESEIAHDEWRRLSRSPEDKSVLMGRRQESTALGMRRVLAGMRPWGTDLSRADDDLNDQESRLIQMDEGIRTFGRGFLLPPGCRQTVDEHDQQQASLSPSEQPSQGQLQEDQDAAGLNNTGNGPDGDNEGNGDGPNTDDEQDGEGEEGEGGDASGRASRSRNGVVGNGGGAAGAREVDLDADMEDMDVTGVTEGTTGG